MYSYKIPYPNGETRGVNVEPFKETTEAYVRQRITEKTTSPLIIKQRLYRDGRWIFRIYTAFAPYARNYHKRYDFFWDYYDIRELLDKVIEDYEEWINSVE